MRPSEAPWRGIVSASTVPKTASLDASILTAFSCIITLRAVLAPHFLMSFQLKTSEIFLARDTWNKTCLLARGRHAASRQRRVAGCCCSATTRARFLHYEALSLSSAGSEGGSELPY